MYCQFHLLCYSLVMLYSNIHVFRSKSDLPQPTGWTFFDLGAEFARQGLPNSSWVSCSINMEWRICPTYPNLVFVPANATSALVVGCAKFRSKGRLPVLTFYHNSTGRGAQTDISIESGLLLASNQSEAWKESRQFEFEHPYFRSCACQMFSAALRSKR